MFITYQHALQWCPGKNRGAGLVCHLSSAVVKGLCETPSINQPINGKRTSMIGYIGYIHNSQFTVITHITITTHSHTLVDYSFIIHFYPLSINIINIITHMYIYIYINHSSFFTNIHCLYHATSDISCRSLGCAGNDANFEVGNPWVSLGKAMGFLRKTYGFP